MLWGRGLSVNADAWAFYRCELMYLVCTESGKALLDKLLILFNELEAGALGKTNKGGLSETRNRRKNAARAHAREARRKGAACL